jgi:glutamate-1-semialdehyde 2,1-aminomutase
MRIAERGIANFSTAARATLFARGQGAFVLDSYGQRYLDLVCGYGPVVLGHCDSDYQAGITSLMAEGLHFPGYSALHDEYATSLPELGPNSAVAFFKTSSEALTAALRLAAISTGKKGLLRCGFLGWHDAQLNPAIGWHEDLGSPLRHRPANLLPFRGISGDELVVDWTDLSTDTLRHTVVVHADQLGAAAIDVFQEDLAGRRLAEDFIRLCREFSIASILDETKSAGRVAPLGATSERDLQPDFVILGKAIANGAPLSVLVIRQYDPEVFPQARVGGTYSKERFSVASALVTQRLMRERDGFAGLRREADRVCSVFNSAAAEAGSDSLVGMMPCLSGSAVRVTLGSAVQGHTQAREKLRLCLQQQGILLLIGHPSFVSLAHRDVPSDWLHAQLASCFRRWRDEFSPMVDSTVLAATNRESRSVRRSLRADDCGGKDASG